MSKGLDALQRIYIGSLTVFDFEKDIETIEKELKRLEELEKAFDSLVKENETLGKMLSKEIEKNRALKIIKENALYVDWTWLFDCVVNNESYEDYEEGCNATNETTYADEEEYELLKEVFL